MTTQNTAKPQGPEVPIIPARRQGVTILCISAFLATIVGLALRILFAYRFPASAGDSEIYLQLAHNWTDHHVYGLWVNGQLVPTDLRMPGYPAFLAGVTTLLRRSNAAILLSQALLDLLTCYLTAMLSAALAPATARRHAWIAGLWLAATCPFVANYTAVVLTEVLVTFLATSALLCFTLGLRQTRVDANSDAAFAVVGAFLTGLATLVRPEMPLLLIAAALVYAFRDWKLYNLRRIALLGAAMAAAFLLPLLPWAARNFVTLHETQFLAPRYATMPDEYAPVGYYAWTRTWLERYRDVYLSLWTIGEEPLNVDNIPSAAFDSPQEKERVTTLLDQYNDSQNLEISPELDHEFAEIAAERTARHPLRTYIVVPFERALTIWFTPRTENLPVDVEIWPLREQWLDSPVNVLVTAGLAALGILYVVLAMAGIVFVCRSAWRGAPTSRLSATENGANLWGIALIVVYLVIRTIFLTTVEAPEPRYVIPCYPAVLALATLLFK